MSSAAFTWNGTNFGTTYNCYVRGRVDIPGFIGEPTRLVAVPASDTLWKEGDVAEPLEMVFPVRIKATSGHTEAQFHAMLLAMEGALNVSGLKNLSFWIAGYHWKGTWDGVPLMYTFKNNYVVYTSIRFLVQQNLIADTP